MFVEKLDCANAENSMIKWANTVRLFPKLKIHFKGKIQEGKGYLKKCDNVGAFYIFHVSKVLRPVINARE